MTFQANYSPCQSANFYYQESYPTNVTVPIVNRNVNPSIWHFPPSSFNNYQLNNDTDPLVVRKRSNKQLEYIQELTIRYLKPPTPNPPGELIIQGK